MNEVVAIHRASYPSDTRSDDDITKDYASSPDAAALAQQYPDFAQQASQLQAQNKYVYQPSLVQDFSRGVTRGTDSLLATGQGAAALGAGVVGANAVKNYFLQKAQANEADAADNLASVPTASDVNDVSSGAHYVAGKLGELAPNLVEAGVTAAAGAAIGSAEPGAGTIAGGIYGLIERQAIKGLIKSGVADAAEDLAPSAIQAATKQLSATYGTHLAETVNFWAQSAGGTYNTLTKNPDVDPGTALNVAFFGGLAQAIPAQYLPSTITKKFFGDAAVGSYFARLGSQAAKIVPGGAAAMSLQELASIASEKYADPKTRADAFNISSWSADDRKRLIESSATGALAGLIGAPLAAVPKGEATPNGGEDIIKSYTGNIPEARQDQINELAQKAADKTLTPEDEDTIKTLNAEQRNAFAVAASKAEPSAPATVDPDLQAVSDRIKENPSPLVPHPELSDEDLLAALDEKPAQPAAAQPAPTPPAEPTPPVAAAPVTGNPATPSPALSAIRAASAAALDPEALDVRQKVAQAAAKADPTPTLAELRSGDFKKGKVNLDGIPISIEHEKGGVRTTKDGLHQVEVPAHYGEIDGTKGADGDPLDVYIGSKPESDRVFVVDQNHADTGAYDESKVMLGFNSKEEASAAYDAAFSDGKGEQRRGAVTETTKAGLRHWIENEDTTKPFAQEVDESSKVKESISDGKRVGIDDLDLENTPLVGEENGRGNNRGKKGAGKSKTFEPSYFEIKPEELADQKTLGDRLVSGARSTDKNAPYQQTKRLTAIQDKETGKVYLTSTYREKGSGDVKMAIPTEAGKPTRSTSLQHFTDQYEPIASVRLGETKKGFVQEFPDREAFEKAISEPAKDQLGTMASHAEEVVAKNTQTIGEHPETGETIENHDEAATPGDEPVYEKEFTPDHANALWQVFGGEEDADFNRKRFDELAKTDLRDSKRGIAAVRAALQSVLRSSDGLTPDEGMQIALNKIYESLESRYSEGKEGFKESAIKSFGNEPSGGGAETAADVKAPEATAGQQPAEQQSEGQKGDNVPDTTAGLKFRKPDGGVQELGGIHDSLLNSIHQAAVEGGVNVQRISQDITGAAGEFARQTGASYDRAARIISQVVADVVGKQDVITSLHEVGHDAFAKLKPELQQAISRAIDRLSDRDLGVDVSVDPRIRSENPSGMTGALVSEERLVEATAIKLQDEGFNPKAAKGFAQTFVRVLKSVYLRAAMAIQRGLLGDKFVDPTLATAFFENRVKQFLAGDFNRSSFIDMLGGGKPPESHVASWHSNGSPVFESMGENGLPEYAHVPDTSLEASRINNLVFRKPDATIEDQKTEAEIRIALQNNTIKHLETAAEFPEIASRLAKSKKSAGQYFSKLLGISNPEMLKKDILTALSNSKAQFDSEKAIGGFKSEAGEGRAVLGAYRNNQELISKVGDVATTEKKAARDAQKMLDKIASQPSLHVEASANKITSLKRRIALSKQRLTAIDALSPVIKADRDVLAGKFGIGAGFSFGDKSEYYIPTSPESKASDLLGERKTGEEPVGWKKQVLKLDTGKNELTNPAEVEGHIRSLKDWLDAQDAKYESGDLTAKGSAYQSQLNVFNELAANKNFSLRVSPSSRTTWGLSMLGPIPQLESVGTPATRSLGARVRLEQSEIDRMQPTVDRATVKNKVLEDQLIKLLPDKMMDKRDTLRRDFLHPIKAEMQAQLDAGEKLAGNQKELKAFLYNRAMDVLKSSDATSEYIKGKEPEWRTGIENLIEHHLAFSEYLQQQVRGAGDLSRTVLGRSIPTGQGVTDPKLKVINPATGKAESAIRKAVPVGPVTFPQKISDTMRSMVNSLRNSGWAVTDENKDTPTLAKSEFGKIAELLKSGNEAEAKAIVDKYISHPEYGDSIQNDFIQPIMQQNTGSVLEAPRGEEETRVTPADSVKIQEAYERHGNDLISLLADAHEAQGGQGDVHDYVQSQLQKLAEVAQFAHNLVKKVEPVGSDRNVGIRGMFSDFALNSREIEGLPGKWFDFHNFDERDAANMMKRIAAQKAYGSGGEAGATDLETAQKEVASARNKLSRAQDKVRRENPTASPKEFKKMVVKEIGGQPEYDKLSQIDKRGDFVQKAADQIISSHRFYNSKTDSLSFVTKAMHTVASAMINQPSSALMLLTQNSDLAVQYGASSDVLKQIGSGYGRLGKEVARSLLAAMGYQLDDNSELGQRFQNGHYTEPSGIRINRDAFQNFDNEGVGAHFFNAASKVLSTPLDRVGEKGSHVPFQLGKIFDYTGVVADKNSISQVWNLAQLHAARAVDFYKDPINSEKLNDPNFKLSADDLGLKGAKKDGYVKFTNDMLNYGMNIDDVARNAVQRNDGTLLTNFEVDKLRSMALHEIALQGGLSNTNAAWRTNSILKLAAPLLQWSLRRSQQIASLPLNAEGKFEMSRLMRAVAGVGVAAVGGLATSALIDQYYQKALGKQRNITPIDASDPEKLGLSLLENISRIGTVGMFGELANTVVGIGQGGDNRDISLDSRVLAASSLLSIMHAAGAYVHQDYNADYTHVVRPLLGSMGGGALIQYMQLANNTFGLDNAEARVTARINAQNYLRVVGRELGLDVRVSDGGTFTPTPTSPYLTQMELAAYKNSPGDFREAYQNAIIQARKDGKDDPVGYVKSAFASRNPLKTVFTTAPSAGDYAKLLANMPGSGQADVSQAVRLFNQYSESIGAKGFEGKTEKQVNPFQTKQKMSMSDLRQKSALALQ